MPRLYKSITAVLAFTGCISLIITGELNPVFLLPGLAVIPGYYRFLRGRPALPKWAIGGLSMAALTLLLFDALIVSADYFIAVAHMTVVFQAIKSFDLRDPWNHLQVYFMSLLQLVMTSELTISMVVGAVFIVFLLALIMAMVFSHFMQERTVHRVGFKRPLIFISIFAFVATAAFFVAIPRVKGGVWGRKSTAGIKSVGFSERVDFGSFGEVLLDSSVVMRVKLSGKRLPLYWRGLALDYFDGLSWKDTLKRRRRIYRTGGRFVLQSGGQKEPAVQKVFVEPMDTSVVFGLGEVTAVESGGRILLKNEAGALFLPEKSNRRFLYTVYSIPYSEPAKNISKYLQIPAGMRRISTLSFKVAGKGRADLERANMIDEFLKTDYKYSLTVNPPPPGMTAVEDFLFNSGKGFCEHYATAMVLMLRSMAIPARIVTGFKGGEENRYGDYVIVRQSNAHSWVEAVIDGVWRRFDPTPPGAPEETMLFSLYLDALRMNWYRYVVGFSSKDQVMLIKSVTMPVFTVPEIRGIKVVVRPLYIVIIVAVFTLLVAVFLLPALKFERHPLETKLYLRFRDRVRKKGGDIRASSTPSEVMREAVKLQMDENAVSEFIRMYEESRFGGVRMDSRMKRIYRFLKD